MDSFQKYYSENNDKMDAVMQTANIVQADIESYYHTTGYAFATMLSRVAENQMQTSYDNQLKDDPASFIMLL
jgi:hypothetical protein